MSQHDPADRASSPAGGQTLRADGATLVRDGVPHRMLSGSVHYFRVHPDLWEDRLLRLRAMGLNTVDTYVPWNWHEAARGTFDFTGWRDVERFVRLAGDLGLDVVVRPGPYICAEWDNGGLPAWLTATPGIRLRCSDEAYLAAVAAWFDELLPRIAALQANRGGPVVAVQVENEYGSFGDDHAYMAWVHDALVERGIDELLFTADGPTDLMLDGGSLPGVLAAATFGSRPGQALDKLTARRGEQPFVCAEFWNGWFDHWGDPHHVRGADSAAADVRDLLDLGGSVSLYMAHGGTNFGLTAGANHDGTRLQPTVTSYDSDAAVAEDGSVTPKFFALRKVLSEHAAHGTRIPEDAQDDRWIVPSPKLAARALPPVSTRPLLPALRASGAAVVRSSPLTFEELGQNAGLVLHTATPVLPPGDSTLSVLGLHDRATVYVDGREVGVLERETSHRGLTVHGEGVPVRLEILVENLGRINYGPRLGEHKGILGDVLVERRIVHGWTSRSLPLDLLPVDGLWAAGEPDAADAPSVPRHAVGPQGVLARTALDLDEPADTFLTLPGWTKGFVWVNDVLLGRYWERGPQHTLYVPAPLLRAGSNTVTVLELHAVGSDLELTDEAVLGEPEEYVEEL
ncbi:glycoside hydrolase family 35 protein [Oerskovia enterophila]|uniref:Beta-galactosidase n=1 Tax=Oerskovia enterophila TaxID=43678 RepID=A0ABX2Y6E0_9CELL|nr:beta-galactosidase [Oerskovia enterophila]OCI32148.1 beta-galactosidase precursor [Oerskovia enterophila]